MSFLILFYYKGVLVISKLSLNIKVYLFFDLTNTDLLGFALPPIGAISGENLFIIVMNDCDLN